MKILVLADTESLYLWDFFEKSKKILKPRGKWYAARAPPPLRESKTYPTFKFSEVTRCVIKRKKFF